MRGITVSKLYVSPEFFSFRTKSELERWFLVSDPDFEYSFNIATDQSYSQSFHNDEEKMGINFKVGTITTISHHLYLDWHLGLGFAYRNVVQTGRENLDDRLDDGINYGLLLEFYDKAAPNRCVLTIPCNLKIGYRF